MKVTKTSNNKLVAVISANQCGLFVRNRDGEGSIFITNNQTSYDVNSLEALLVQSIERQPIYQGDEITIQF